MTLREHFQVKPPLNKYFIVQTNIEIVDPKKMLMMTIFRILMDHDDDDDDFDDEYIEIEDDDDEDEDMVLTLCKALAEGQGGSWEWGGGSYKPTFSIRS